jgi:carbonic anhydrase
VRATSASAWACRRPRTCSPRSPRRRGVNTPAAFVLSCVDSRVPVETVFDQGIGDVFVGRVAGNIIDDQMLGSMEFATAVAGAPLILVMGHTACGAVKGACDNVDVGHVTALVRTIQPSVEAVTPEGESCSSSNSELVDAVATHNVSRTVEDIRTRSEIIRDLEARGEVRLVGAMYDLSTGVVTFIE